MDSSKHTVTLPIDDYNKLIKDNHKLLDRAELAEAKLNLIKEVMDYPVMDRIKRFDEIKTILGD